MKDIVSPKKKTSHEFSSTQVRFKALSLRQKIIRHGFIYFGNAERPKQQRSDSKRVRRFQAVQKHLAPNLERHLPDILYTRISASVGPRPSRGPYGLPFQAPPVYPLKISRLTHMAPQMERMRMTCIFQRVALWKHTSKARLARHYMLS